jgi:hypothetical protein
MNGFPDGLELLRAERNSNGFLGHLSGPLIARARRVQGGAIQNRTLANIAEGSQGAGEALVFLVEGFDPRGF